MSASDASRDRPGPGWRLMLRLMTRLPQPALSRLTGRLADLTIPGPLRRPLLGAFARVAGIDVAEAERPLSEYESFDAFFVRRLREGARPWLAGKDGVGSPVDGILGESGNVEAGRLLQAKGRSYTVAELLADPACAEVFSNGTFVTIYLSPRHYHRIHAPTAGGIEAIRRIPGALLPVNQPAVMTIDRLFPRNERAVCTMRGPTGTVAVVAIGAYNVGRITASFLKEAGPRPLQLTNLPGAGAQSRIFEPPVEVEGGDEIMAFHLGSTIVLLFERDRVALVPSLRIGTEVRMGTTIASFASENDGS